MARETENQAAICEYLEKRKHFFWRQNNGGVWDAKNNVFRKKGKYQINGVPDVIVIHQGFFIGLEVKKKGTYQSKEEKEFEKRCKEAGGEYYVVRSIDDVKEIGL
jgi:hypothetical protein